MWPALRVLVDRSRAIFIALSVLFKLRLSGERVRAFFLHETLSAVYEVTMLCFEQVGLSADAIRDADGAAATFFVDELLSLCSELTCLAVCRAAL